MVACISATLQVTLDKICLSFPMRDILEMAIITGLATGSKKRKEKKTMISCKTLLHEVSFPATPLSYVH
jgi:hypothetical protein